MEWPDRNQVWRQVEVTLIECTTGETQEGRAGGEGVWNTRHAALTSAIQQWSASKTRHAEAAYDAADDPTRAPRPQNPQELLALVEAARASTTLAMASERRCSEERATLAALHIQLNDTTHCQLCPTGHGTFQQTRWHVLGRCQHPDLKDARRKAALELQSKTHSTFTQKIKDPRGRLPYWRQLFAITPDDRWVWPDDEPGINAKSGWQISHWWGLWVPNRMDKWATDHQDQGNPVSAREWAALIRALQQLG
jgi:hypothetical protein